MKIIREYECGCSISSERNYPSIDYCPLHKVAPDMYEALKATRWAIVHRDIPMNYDQLLRGIEQALAEVEGK